MQHKVLEAAKTNQQTSPEEFTAPTSHCFKSSKTSFELLENETGTSARRSRQEFSITANISQLNMDSEQEGQRDEGQAPSHVN